MRKFVLLLCIIMTMVLNSSCTSKRPEISEEALTEGAEAIEMYDEIKDAEVMVENNKIYFYILPESEDVPKERLRELSILFLKALSGYTVNEELKGPTDKSYGEIYDYYNVEITVEGYRGAVIDKGIKDKGQNEVKWQ